MLVPIPQSISQKISDRAAVLAREKVRGYGWSDKAIGAIQAMPGEGRVGIKTSVKYLMYQDRGIKPFVMWWVEGKTIPMKGPGGTHFVRGHEPGKPGYVMIPGRGRVWRDQKWKHPGLKPKNFLEDAISQAIKEARPQLQQMLNSVMGQGK